MRRFLSRFQGAFYIDYRSIWCRDFTIICITKKLEVKIPAYTGFIFDVHKSYHVEKLVLVFIGSKRNFITAANIRLSYGKRIWNKIADIENEACIHRHFNFLFLCNTNYSKIKAQYWSIIYSKSAPWNKWIKNMTVSHFWPWRTSEFSDPS